MCGIAGILSEQLSAIELGDALRRMQEALVHRGPDDSGEAVLQMGQGRIGLAHRRLSILDLSSAGRQPMVHAPSGCHLVFNGEIYNFRQLRSQLVSLGEMFASHSDSEVLLIGLVRHGEDFLSRLEGMFSFAFYDPRTTRLLMARDPLGIKPLYWAETPQAIVVASEVRALLASGLVDASIDRRGLASALAYGGVQQPLSLFSKIQSLPPGTYLEITPYLERGWRKSGPHRHWNYPATASGTSVSEAIAATREQVQAAVRDHLVSDVRVGVFLSGGIDSTILAGVAREFSPQINCLTVDFDESPEGGLAERTASQFGLPHTMVRLTEEQVQAAVADWLGALDQPSMDGLNVYMISRAVRDQGIKVALSGVGGDELFGGYPSFRDCPRLLRLMRRVQWMPAGVRRMVVQKLMFTKPPSYRRKLADILGRGTSLRSICLGRRRLMSDEQMRRLALDARELNLSDDFEPSEAFSGLPDAEDAVCAVSLLESHFYQSNILLRDADAMGMAHGLEIRVPFLDRRLIDRVFAFDGSVRLPPGAPQKYLLRAAFPELFRDELLAQRKLGFSLPIGRWLRGPLRDWCHEAVASLDGVLPLREVSRMLQTFECEPESPSWSRIFMLAVLGDFVARSRRLHTELSAA